MNSSIREADSRGDISPVPSVHGYIGHGTKRTGRLLELVEDSIRLFNESRSSSNNSSKSNKKERRRRRYSTNLRLNNLETCK